jgi:hypothetical protein
MAHIALRISWPTLVTFESGVSIPRRDRFGRDTTLGRQQVLSGMNAPAKSVLFFGIYLVVVGVGLLAAPNALLGPLGFPPAEETWLRVVGVLALVLSSYYILAARAGLSVFFRWTVAVRGTVFLAFATLVLLGFAPPPLVLLGAVDLAGAAWTWFALRAAVRN